jgi:tRNA(Ser,Leu) C12 N-acetylase TAN1
MRNAANLLITYDVANRFAAHDEIRQVLTIVGEEQPDFLPSRVHGLVQISVTQDPKAVTLHLDALCRTDPSRFWYTYHWIPVETWCPATIPALSDVVTAFAARIDPDERWRLRINTRFYTAHHTRELIDALAQLVARPHVDLEHPDKTIRIEIIGDTAALALLTPREQFSVHDVKNEVFTTR